MNGYVQVGWVKRTDEELFHVTQAGYTAARQLAPAQVNSLSEIQNQMPSLIAEIKADLSTDDGKHVREFFVLKKGQILGGSEKPRFAYYEEDHANLRGMLDVLENRNLIIDVTPKNCPVYRMTEEFVHFVLQSTSEV